MNDLRFEPSSGEDLPALQAMVLGLYTEDSCGQPMSVEKIRDTVAELSARPDKGRIVLFRLAGTVVGYAIVLNFWSNEYGGDLLVVDELYVRPGWRRRGIAGAFIAQLCDQTGPVAKGLMLELTPGNQRALDLYRRQGFHPDPNRHLIRIF